MSDRLTILQGDCLDQLKTLPDESVNCCVTSPPYWGLRDYGHAGQIGLEPTPEEYVAKLVSVFSEVRRVLRKDGTLWLNLGDSYAGGGTVGRNDTTPDALARRAEKYGTGTGNGSLVGKHGTRPRVETLKPKDLCGIPWRVAFALQADGWYLRSDIIWAKPNPMPESVTDRPTKAHEYIFLLTKSERYAYDAEAIKEQSIDPESLRPEGRNPRNGDTFTHSDPDGKARTRVGFAKLTGVCYPTRNKRTVWTVPTAPFSDWTETVRWQRVEAGAASGGSLHIASPDCPVYGGLFDLVATALCDGRGDGDWNRICSICDRLSLTPKAGFSPIETLRAWNLRGQSLDSVVQQCCGSATENSTGTRRTDLFVSTSLACKPSAQRSSRIRRTLAECGLSEQCLDMLLSNTWVDGFGDNQKPETIYRTVGKGNLQELFLALGPTYRKEATKSSHFATFPPDLIKPCILAGCPAGGTVLDPFGGSGTTGQVALELGRKAILIELNPAYVELIEQRTNITPGLALA
jgi:DNA modification methylase